MCSGNWRIDHFGTERDLDGLTRFTHDVEAYRLAGQHVPSTVEVREKLVSAHVHAGARDARIALGVFGRKPGRVQIARISPATSWK